MSVAAGIGWKEVAPIECCASGNFDRNGIIVCIVNVRNVIGWRRADLF